MKQMKKQFLFLVLLCYALNSIAQQNANFTFSPEKPTNGQTIQINYDAKGTSLEGKQKIAAVVYQYKNYKWVGADLSLNGSANHWQAKYDVPVDCGLIALKFKSDTSVDNNHDIGYFILMNDKDRAGAMAPGAYAGWGLARSPKYGKDIPGYINFKGISDTATYHWLNQEISFNQNAKQVLALDYAIALKEFMGDAGTPKLTLVCKYLTRPDATESDLLKARHIYKHLMIRKESADSVDRVINSRFPKGSLARLAAFRKAFASRDVDSILTGAIKFLADFPEYKTDANFDLENRINYGVIYQNVMVFGTMKGLTPDYVIKYADSISFNMLTSIYYKLIGIPYHRKEGDLLKLAKYSDLLVKRYESFKENRPESMQHLSPSEWETEYRRAFVSTISADHIGLLNLRGKYEQALKYVEDAQGLLNYSKAEINNEHAIILKKLNKVQALEQLLVKSFFNNQSSTEMIGMLKEIYVKKHKSDKGYDAYLESLKNPVDKLKNLEELKATMIKAEMPTWSMKDLNGKTVNSSDLKGKIVILDFWATWCVPCKASFPGMKLAVEKYKNDPNVVFYFVDTEERGDTYKAENAKYIKDNNYPFNVLFDNKVEGMKTNSEVFSRICKAFTISGIPQKLIIDKNGFLRFISVGFKGSATGLADEMSDLIEMTKTAE